MGVHKPERTGVLVIRVWIEDNPEAGLRARITSTLDITRPDQEVTSASSVEDIHETLRAWLEAFIEVPGPR